MSLRPGSTVHLCLPNTTEYYFPVFASWLCGAVASVADPSLPASVTAIQLGETDASVVFCVKNNVEKVKEAVDKCGREVHVVIVATEETEADKDGSVYDFGALVKEAEELEDIPAEINATYDAQVINKE